MRKKYGWITVAAVAVALICIRVYPRPPLSERMDYSTAVYARGGEFMRLTLAQDGMFRLYTPLPDISPALAEATLFYEDRYFRYHPGINPFAVARSFWSSYVAKSRKIGASTITMQLARKIYRIDSASFDGKIKQMASALWLEARYSKDEILEAYLNTAPYGHNIEGIGAAGFIYFHKRARVLNTLESFTLCVIPQNPSKRTPTTDNGFAGLKKARDPLVRRWVEAGGDSAVLGYLPLPVKISSISDLPFYAPHFTESLLKQLPAGEIFTTLDMDRQSVVENRLKEFVAENRIFGIHNAAAVLVNAKTMEVEASVGSAGFFNGEIQGQVDGTRALRSPGSVLKPFIYALAIDEGLIHPRTMLKDARRRYGLYSPENADRGFMGPVFAQEALIASRNVPAVELLLTLKKDAFLNLLRSSGVKKLRSGEYYGAALALGGFEVTMEDVAKLYTSLLNGGRVFPLRKTAGETSQEPVRIFSGEAAYIVNDMLQHNPPPMLNGFYFRPPLPVGWKTGTSFRFKDGWTAGTFGDYVLVVWVGNFDGQENTAFMGRRSAAPFFFSIVRDLMPFLPLDTQAEGIPPDLNVRYVDVCAVTGELPADYCPQVIPALFIPGVSPIKVSDVYMRIPVDKATGLRACRYSPDTTEWQVYEFWPADILEIFEKAGIRRKTPPRYMPGCSIDHQSYQGAPPTIVYPQPDLIYDMTNAPGGGTELPLTATATADAEKVFWFVDNRFVGESPNGKPFFWKPQPGKHFLQAVDNLGRSASVIFEVS